LALAILCSSSRQQVERNKTPSLTLFVPRRSHGFIEDNGEVRLRNILIPVDKVPNPQIAIGAASLLARTLGCKDVHFILLHVGSDSACPQVEIPIGPGWTSEIRTWDGEVADHILSAARVDEADLIVMATSGHHGFLDALRGSTTERILHGTEVPLLAVPAGLRRLGKTTSTTSVAAEAMIGVT
jgi:hypothetical protein